MLKIVLLLLFCFANVCNASIFETPHQPRFDVQHGNTETYLNHDPLLFVPIEEHLDYGQWDQIFIFPKNYYGGAELYTLGFFVDRDTHISNDFLANDYRITHIYSQVENEQFNIVPELPSFLSLLILSSMILFYRRNRL